MHSNTSSQPSTIQEIFVRTRNALMASGINDSDIEAEVLVRHLLSMDRSQYFASLSDIVTSENSDKLNIFVKMRLAGEPLAYITGIREFYGLEFEVNRNVLIPRQETELLVDLALEYISNREKNGQSLVSTVADVCTGSGAVGVALAVNCPSARIYATDISQAAIEVAKQNALTHKVADRVSFVQNDLMDGVQDPYDLILSNPPYIPHGMLDTLDIEVRNEPRIALDGGSDGLEIFRRLIEQSGTMLHGFGALMVELMPEQMDVALELARETFPNAEVGYTEDLAGNARALTVYSGGQI
jgi:release factor glutamine methyltransferase